MVALFVAFMFVSLVLTDLSVEKWKAWQAARAIRPAESTAAFGLEALWQVPDGVHLSTAHTWFRPDPAGGLELGADSLIAHAIGAVRQIVLPRPGDHVITGQPLFRLVRDGRSITVPSTLTGKVSAVNSLLSDEPGRLNSDPYGSGWVCRITPTSVGAVEPSTRFGEKAMMWLESEFTRLREFLSAQVNPELALGMTSQDGGVPASGCLAELDNSAWNAFESEFLKWN
jgi:glycine cleavage system H protein